VIVDSLVIDRDHFERGTGWELRPEGACNGDICVPLDSSGDEVELTALAERLGMALVHEETEGLWALGPASVGGRALTSAQAPDLKLPDLDGRPFKLSSLRGQKVVLVAWAPY
jgi:hypothetical protein